MEVTTVSPSPASPTEVDDLCETDVTKVAIHSVTLLVCLCGLAGNWAVICLYSLKSDTLQIFYLAVTDFLFLLFTVPSTLLFLVEDMSCSPIVPFMYVSFVFHLSQLSYFWGLFRLMLCNYTANILDLCELCCGCDVPLRLFLVVDGVQGWTFYALFTLIPTLTSLCPLQEREHCQAALISMYAVILLLFAAPMVIIPIINIISARRASRKQQPKRRDIVVFLVLLFPLLLVLFNFLQQLGYMFVSTQVFFLLTCIYSSIKPFIYFLVGRCWSPCSMESLRLSLQRVFEEENEKKTACSDDANTDTVL